MVKRVLYMVSALLAVAVLGAGGWGIVCSRSRGGFAGRMWLGSDTVSAAPRASATTARAPAERKSAARASSAPAPAGASVARPLASHASGIVLWAWEQREDLRFLNSGDANAEASGDANGHATANAPGAVPDGASAQIAFLARTIFLNGGGIEVKPRLQPLQVSRDARLIAVARLEVSSTTPTKLSQRQLTETAAAISEMARLPQVAAVQIDFDATASQRAFYLSLLRGVRARLPAGTPLSITALASWCMGDSWLDAAPVDEAVPMLFRMGPSNAAVRAALARGGDFGPAVCRQSVGISTDEPPVNWPSGRKVYVFHSAPWTDQEFQQVAREMRGN